MENIYSLLCFATVCTHLSSRTRYQPVCIPREGCCCLVSPTTCSANSRKVSKISPPVLGNIFYSLIVAFSAVPEHCHDWDISSWSHWSTRGWCPGHWSFGIWTLRMSWAWLSWLSGHSHWRMIVTDWPVSAALLRSWPLDSRGFWSHGRAGSWGLCWCSSWRGSWCSSASAASDGQRPLSPADFWPLDCSDHAAVAWCSWPLQCPDCSTASRGFCFEAGSVLRPPWHAEDTSTEDLGQRTSLGQGSSYFLDHSRACCCEKPLEVTVVIASVTGDNDDNKGAPPVWPRVSEHMSRLCGHYDIITRHHLHYCQCHWLRIVNMGGEILFRGGSSCIHVCTLTGELRNWVVPSVSWREQRTQVTWLPDNFMPAQLLVTQGEDSRHDTTWAGPRGDTVGQHFVNNSPSVDNNYCDYFH